MGGKIAAAIVGIELNSVFPSTPKNQRYPHLTQIYS